MTPIKKRLSIILVSVLLILAATPALASDYIGNANTMKFHYADCKSVSIVDIYCPIPEESFPYPLAREPQRTFFPLWLAE